MYTNNRILLQTNMFNLEKVEIMKKVFYKSLILAFSATMLSANVNAQFAGGTGTESDPYIIQTAEQLNEVRNYLDGNNFRLDNDIDLTSYLAANSAENGWLPIGSDPEGIIGSFDGNGHVISGFYINRPETSNVGLFGFIKSSGIFSVKKLGLIIADGKEVKGLDNVGGIIGQVPYTGQTIKITECFVIGNITAEGNGAVTGTATGTAGSIIAMTSALGRVELLNCYAAGKVYGFCKAGGLVGQGYRGIKIESSYSTCEVEAGTNKSQSKAGGLIGECGFPNGNAIRHDVIYSIALNPSVKAPNSPDLHIGRLVGFEKPDNTGKYNYEVSYAWADMLVNDAAVTDGQETNKNGLNQSSNDVIQETIYFGDNNNDYLFWDPAIWSMGNGKYQLPILKAFAADKQPDTKVAHLPERTSTGITMSSSEKLSVYPTLTKDKITITNKADNTKVSIYDQVGKLVMTSFDSEISIATLNSGIYLLNVQGTVVKIVKE